MKTIAGFKAAYDDMCRGIPIQVGKTCIHPTDKVQLCWNGFHYCENLFDVFGYYSWNRPVHVFRVIDLNPSSMRDKSLDREDKRTTNKLFIESRINARELAKYHKKCWELNKFEVPAFLSMIDNPDHSISLHSTTGPARIKLLDRRYARLSYYVNGTPVCSDDVRLSYNSYNNSGPITRSLISKEIEPLKNKLPRGSSVREDFLHEVKKYKFLA